MSEEAHFWNFKREYGHYPDEDGPRSVENEIDYPCDGCGREMHGLTESGLCFACEAEFLAKHQLTFSELHERLLHHIDMTSCFAPVSEN